MGKQIISTFRALRVMLEQEGTEGLGFSTDAAPPWIARGLITPPDNPCGVHVDSRTPRMFHEFHKSFFWQERHSNLGFSPWTVHGILMNLFNFHGIHTDSPRIPHGLSPWSVHG